MGCQHTFFRKHIFLLHIKIFPISILESRMEQTKSKFPKFYKSGRSTARRVWGCRQIAMHSQQQQQQQQLQQRLQKVR